MVRAPSGTPIRPPTDTRRELLSSGATGLAALAVITGAGAGLTGCGGSSGAGPHQLGLAGPGEGDVDLLNGVLGAEQRAIAGYTALTPLLGGAAQRAAGRFLAQDLAHAGELRALIKRIGGHPREPSAGGAEINFRGGGPPRVLELLHGLEQAQIAAYLSAVPAVSSRLLRAALASMMANDAQHVAVLREELGLTPLTGAFLSATS